MSKRELNPVAKVVRVIFSVPFIVVELVKLLVLRDEVLAYSAPTVEQDMTAEPMTAVAVAIPASLDDVPTASLAPVLALTYTPAQAKDLSVVFDALVKAAKKKPAKAKVQASAAQQTKRKTKAKVEVRYVRRGRRYVEVAKAKVLASEAQYVKTAKGKAVRYVKVS